MTDNLNLNDTLLASIKFPMLVNSKFTNEEAMLFYALISFYNDVVEDDYQDGRDILVQSLLDRAYSKDIRVIKKHKTNISNMIQKIKNNLYNALTGEKVVLFDELDVIWRKPNNTSYLVLKLNESAAKEYLHFSSDEQYMKVRLAPLRDLISISYKRAYILFSQWTDYTGEEKYFFINNANFIEAIYGDRKLSGLTYRKYKTHYLEKIINALGIWFPNIEFRLNNRDNILYKNSIKFKITAQDKEFFDKYALYKRVELSKHRNIVELGGSYNFEDKLKDLAFANMTKEEILALDAQAFQPREEETFAEISEDDFYSDDTTNNELDINDNKEEQQKKLEDFRNNKEEILDKENILDSRTIDNQKESLIIDNSLEDELNENDSLRIELEQYDLGQDFVGIIDRFNQERKLYPGKDNYEFSTGLISNKPNLVNDLNITESEALKLYNLYGPSRSFNLDSIMNIDDSNKYFSIYKSFLLISLLKNVVYNKKEQKKYYEYSKEEELTLFEVLEDLYSIIEESLANNCYNVFDASKDLFTDLGYSESESINKIIDIVKSLNYALAMYEEFKPYEEDFDNEENENTLNEDFNYESNLTNVLLNKNNNEKVETEKIKQDYLNKNEKDSKMIPKELQKEITNEVITEVENKMKILHEEESIDSEQILSKEKLELEKYKDNYRDLRFGFEDSTIESSKVLIPDLEKDSYNELKRFIEFEVKDGYSKDWSITSTKKMALYTIKLYEDKYGYSPLKMFNQFLSNKERLIIKENLDKLWQEIKAQYEKEFDRIVNIKDNFAKSIPNFYEEIFPNMLNNEDNFRKVCEWSTYGDIARTINQRKEVILIFIEKLSKACQRNIDRSGQMEGVYNKDIINKNRTMAYLNKKIYGK